MIILNCYYLIRSRIGYADMAVSNAIGSNIFDILICLGIPWFLQTAIVRPGAHVTVYSKGTCTVRNIKKKI